MPRISNKKLIRKRIKESLTVAQLIEHLRTLPQGAPVGKVGHFGEFNEIKASGVRLAFYVRETFVTASDSYCDDNRKACSVVDISVPDIGPDPD